MGTRCIWIYAGVKVQEQVSITTNDKSIIISHTHAPLQLCIVVPLLWSPLVSLQIVICSDNTEL